MRCNLTEAEQKAALEVPFRCTGEEQEFIERCFIGYLFFEHEADENGRLGVTTECTRCGRRVWWTEREWKRFKQENDVKAMFDINEVPYAEWLEKSLQAIVPLKPVSLCFAATMPDGEVYTGYYNADATDKAVIAHNIQADITMDIIRTNAAIIKDMIEHCEEDE